MPLGVSSSIQTPDGLLVPGGGGGGNGTIPLGELWRPMRTPFSSIGVGQPITSDTGVVQSAPSTSGMVFFAWNTTTKAFNKQSQNWIAAPTTVTGGASACMNRTTPRQPSTGSLSASFYPSNIDFWFETDSQNVMFVWYYHTGYTGNGGQDMQLYIEHEGYMRPLTEMPSFLSGSQGLSYRKVTKAQARMGEWRANMGAYQYLLGVYIDVNAVIRPGKNKLLFAIDGDSWDAPTNAHYFSSGQGQPFATNSSQSVGLPQSFVQNTGAAAILVAQDGTGFVNANGPDGDPNDTALTSTVFLSSGRVNDADTQGFLARSPLWWVIGGWNDGARIGIPYRSGLLARMKLGFDKLLTKKNDLQFMASTIQPVDFGWSSPTDYRVQQTLAQLDLLTAYPDNCIGVVDESNMWTDRSSSGPRSVNTGSDGLHLLMKGCDQVSKWHLATAAHFPIPIAYYEAMLSGVYS